MEKLGFEVESQPWIWKLPLPLVNREHFFPTPKFSSLERKLHCVTVGLSLYIPFGPWNVEWFIRVVELGKAPLTSNFHLGLRVLGGRGQISPSVPLSLSLWGVCCPGWWCWPLVRWSAVSWVQVVGPLDSGNKPALNWASIRDKG